MPLRKKISFYFSKFKDCPDCDVINCQLDYDTKCTLKYKLIDEENIFMRLNFKTVEEPTWFAIGFNENKKQMVSL
jgi:hypothetical protein